MKYFQWISVAGLMVAISALLPGGFGPATPNRSGETKTVPRGVEQARNANPAMPLDPEDSFAWDEFAALVHPAYAPGAKPPDWLAWYNKCDAGLSAACETSSRMRRTLPEDEAAAEFPRQLFDHPEQIRQGVFDSVLYNPVAADSIRRSNLGKASSLDLAIQQLDMQNLSGADRRLPLGTFALGSEIVKLIWEAVPDNDVDKKDDDKKEKKDKEVTLRLYDPVNPPVVSDGTQLFQISAWKARYILLKDKTGRIDQSTPCSEPLHPYGTEHAPQTVPITCFQSFLVHKNSCSSFSHDVQQAFACGPSMTSSFRVFLVGFHVMKLTAGNSDWIWSTYYWTRETNERENGGQKWNAPWNHFHQMTTTVIRENALPPHDICYNPYLEGQQKNGVKANCLSCHSFAAYALNVDKLSEGGGAHGAEYPYLRAKRIRDELDYFRGAVQTSFVWSISTNQNKPDSK